MATFYVQTTGAATNSGSTDTDSPTLTGTAASQSGATITLDGTPDLSGVVTTAGATQSTIYLNDATNANTKIFKITAVNDGADTVDVTPTPTGTIAGACQWSIGGRLVWTPANIEAALAAGDTVIFNDSPAASASTLITCRASGTGAAGFITLKGKTGTLPKLNHTSTAAVITANSQTTWKIENLELDQDGATGTACAPLAAWLFLGVKVSDAGSGGGIAAAGACAFINCEITGSAGAGLTWGSNLCTVIGCYIHDNVGDGILNSGSSGQGIIINNIFDSNGGRGYISNSASIGLGIFNTIYGNTFYANGNSGLEITDADCTCHFINNVFSENGNAAGESNVEWVNGTGQNISFHGYNTFFHSGGGSATNLTNVTATATEATTDPAFTSPAAGDFTIGSSSPAKATGFPGVLGIAGGTGFMDMGALQREEPVGGGGVVARVIGG